MTLKIYFCPRRCVNQGCKRSPLSAEGKTQVPPNLQAGESDGESWQPCTHSHEACDASAVPPFMLDSDQSERHHLSKPILCTEMVDVSRLLLLSCINIRVCGVC